MIPILSCAYSPNSRRIVSGARDGVLRVWNPEEGSELATLVGHEGPVTGCAYSPDGRRIVSASKDGTLKIWDAESGAELTTLTGHSDGVTTGAYSPDGMRIVSASKDGTLKIWDAESGAELAILAGHSIVVTSCAYSPDGMRIVSASGDRTLKIWDTESLTELATLTGHSNWVTSCAYSPDSMRIVSASDDGTLKIWDAESGSELATLTGHSDGVTACAYSPDGRRIVSASWYDSLKVWDAETGNQLTTLDTQPVSTVAYSPDGWSIVSASADGKLKVWNAETGALVVILPISTEIARSEREQAYEDSYYKDLATGDERPYSILAGDQARGSIFDEILSLERDEVAYKEGSEAGAEPAHQKAYDKGWVAGKELGRDAYREATLASQRTVERSGDFAASTGTAPLPYDNDVMFTVFRPATIVPRKWHSLLAFAHLSERRPDAPPDEPDPIAEVQRQAQQILGETLADYKQSSEESSSAIPRADEITFKPFIEGIEFNPAIRSFRWEESVHREEFKMRASSSLDGQTARGWLRVYLGPLILAQINLSIKVDSKHVSAVKAQSIATESARPLRKVFAS